MAHRSELLRSKKTKKSPKVQGISESQSTSVKADFEPVLADLLLGNLSLGRFFCVSKDLLKDLTDKGIAYLRAGKCEDARKIFAGLAALEPNVATFHQLLGMAYEHSNRLREAEQEYSSALECLKEDKQKESIFMAYFARGSVRSRLGEVQKALVDFELAKRYESSSTRPLDKQLQAAVDGAVVRLTQGAF